MKPPVESFVNRRSETEIFGIPLVHVAFGTQNGKKQLARGIIAIGDIAVGGFACGGLAAGGVAVGGCSAGLISFGGCALGLLLALGGCAAGGIAFGGFAVGLFAYGGFACGHTVVGGFAYGVHGLGGEAMVSHELAKTHWLYQLQGILMANHWILLACIALISVVPTLVMLCGHRWASHGSRERSEAQ